MAPFHVADAETAFPLTKPFRTISRFDDILMPNGPLGPALPELASIVVVEQPMYCGPEMFEYDVAAVAVVGPSIKFAPTPPPLTLAFGVIPAPSAVSPVRSKVPKSVACTSLPTWLKVIVAAAWI